MFSISPVITGSSYLFFDENKTKKKKKIQLGSLDLTKCDYKINLLKSLKQ